MEIVLIVLVSLFCGIAVFLSMRKDMYEQGFDDGLHSQLGKLAKQRYNREVDCVLFVVPKDEYEKELDQIA